MTFRMIDVPNPPPDVFGLTPDMPMGMTIGTIRGEWFHTDDLSQDPPVWVEVTDPEEIVRLKAEHEKNKVDLNEIYHPFESARDAWFAD